MAIRTLIENKVHRIPVIDPITHDFLFLVTHKRILRFLYLYVCQSIVRKERENVSLRLDL